MLSGLGQPDVLVPRAGVPAQFPAQLPQPVQDARRDGHLRPRPVPVELLDDERGDEQFKLAVGREYAQRHDPALAIAARG